MNANAALDKVKIARKVGTWVEGVGYHYLCDIEGCNKPHAGYYDITVTGIGDFIFHCDEPAHEAAVFAEGERIDAERRQRSEQAAALADGWIWSLEQPEVSGWRWILTWDENALELGVTRFTVGDILPANVACWRYVEPPARG